jgi:flagellin
MPGIGGLSIANNLLANTATLNLNKSQSMMGTLVTQLSSGLRINTAADDPSGLAIASSLQSQVNGFDQASRNVQDATNAAQVAEGALQTTTDILQRIRTLAVEGSSDIVSTSDRQNLQSEVQQLLLEVNRISQDTNFNGQSLLDGSHAGFQQQVNAAAVITSNADLAGGGTLVGGTYNAQSGFQVSLNTTSASIADGTIEVQVSQVTSTLQGVVVSFFTSGGAYGSNALTGQSAVSAASNPSAGEVLGTIIFANGCFQGAAASQLTQFAPGLLTVGGFDPKTGLAQIAVDGVSLDIGSVGTLDVGTTSYVKVSQYVAAQSNPNAPAFNFQSGASEGATIQVGFASTSTNSLRIANINLVGNTGFGSLASEDAIGQIDNALQSLLSQRASLGATIVRLQEDQTNANTASVNLQASESAIRDLNIGAATTAYTKTQILIQVGTSVLSQSNSNAQSVLSLFR